MPIPGQFSMPIDILRAEVSKKKFLLKREARLPWDLIDSAAYYALKGAKAVQVLIRFYQKRTWVTKRRGKPEYNGKGLSYTYGEAREMGISPSQFHTIIKLLFEMGFIDIEHQGGGLARDYSRYALSERWRDFGTDKFRRKEKPRAGRPGCDVRSWMRRKAQSVEADERHDQASEDAGENKQTTADRNCQLREGVIIPG
jgi:hypothetical protein